MRKSARILGQDFGLTAQEMNFVLKEEGFLDGDPGNYAVTEKGLKFAEDNYNGRSYGYYNQGWPTRTWDDRIADELDITEDRKKEIRQAISIAKQKINESQDESIAIECDSCINEDANNNALVMAVGALLVAVSAYGIYKAAPYIKRWWKDKAVPNLKKMKNKVTNKAEKMYKKIDRDKSSSDL